VSVPAPGFVRRRWDALTLRGRLIATIIALLAMICLIIGVFTGLVLRRQLIGQMDDRITGGPKGGGFDRTICPTAGQGAPVDPDALEALFHTDGKITACYADHDTREWVALNDAQKAVLAALPVGEPVTRNIPDLGDYRLFRADFPAQGAPGRGGAVSPDAVGMANGVSFRDTDATLLRLAVTEICVALAGMIGVGLIGEVLINRTLRPLRRVAATATRVSEMRLDRGDVALSDRVPEADTDPRTEVGQVGAALNRMIGHVSTALEARQASETRVRQFVADASHELRTPLAAIRGYAELTRRMDGEVPPDVQYAMDRVESESARMTTLVEDLLLLARIDSGRPLEDEPVDLTRLAIDAISDAHVAASGYTWRLHVPDEPVTVRGDAARMHQVLANLLANARTHTPPGTAVDVMVAQTDDGGATLRVRDNGPGIEASLLPDVFDRFARADSSRSRAAGSTGLGLAIVAAVVEAHGGEVSVASEPGRTEFTVVLPVTPRPPS
jgi:two-component system OmpR family sensor kinase